MDTADQIVEVSLKRIAERYGKMPAADLQRLLQDPGVVDVIKSDYRGNLILAINRRGEQILRDLVKQAKAQEAKQPRLQKRYSTFSGYRNREVAPVGEVEPVVFSTPQREPVAVASLSSVR